MSLLELLLVVAVVVAIVKVVNRTRRSNPDDIKPDYWGAVKVLAKQYRVVLLGLAGLIFALGIFGATNNTTEPSRPATTTVRRSTTTTLSHLDECAERIADVQHTTQLVLLSLDDYRLSLALGAWDDAEAYYENVDVLAYSLNQRMDRFLADCRQYSPGTAAELEEAADGIPGALAEMRRECRQFLAPLGFDCG